MANCIIVMGPSGTGKSTSVKSLNPKETYIINVLGKRLPFKGSAAVYNDTNKNISQLDDYSKVNLLLTNIGEKEGAKHIKNVVIDDSIYVMRKEYFRKAEETGYAKYTRLAQHFQSIIETCEKLRPDLNIFFILHSEEITSDGTIVGYQVSTIGKLLLSQYNPIECVPMVLFSSTRYNDKGHAEYGFYTHRCRVGAAEIPAKTPDGLFEEDFIPNDLGMVVSAMEEYYK